MFDTVEARKGATVKELIKLVESLGAFGAEELERKVELLEESLITISETIVRQKTKNPDIIQSLEEQKKAIINIHDRIEAFRDGKPIDVKAIVSSLEMVLVHSELIRREAIPEKKIIQGLFRKRKAA